MPNIKISGLAIYPLKSAAQIVVQDIDIDQFGFRHDRRWMIVDRDDQFVTQRQHPRLCLLQQFLQDDSLALSAPGLPTLVLSSQGSSYRDVSVWRDRCRAIDCGDVAASWISEFLGQACRIVYFPADARREVDKQYAKHREVTAFSDGFPILLIAQASLDDLNRRLAQPIEMRRFRPNLVVSGCDAYAEDQWKILRIGDVELHVVKPCSRCVIPSIDPATGIKQQEPTRTLLTYRRKGEKIYFGQNVLVQTQGTLSLGMPVEVIA